MHRIPFHVIYAYVLHMHIDMEYIEDHLEGSSFELPTSRFLLRLWVV